MKLVLVKRTDVPLEGERADAVRSFLFGDIDGATDKDKRAWRRFVRALHEAGSGEFFTIETARRRDGRRHRKHMALLTSVFNAQERIEDFEAFRIWVKLAAGHVAWLAGPRGGVFPVPKPTNFDDCEEDEFIEYVNAVLAFFRTEHAQHYLWPNLSAQLAEQSMLHILDKFEWSPS